MRTRMMVSLLATAMVLLSALPVLAQPAPADAPRSQVVERRTATHRAPVFKLTLLGDVPDDATFWLWDATRHIGYVADRALYFCPVMITGAPCRSGVTYVWGGGRLRPGTPAWTRSYRYQASFGGRGPITLYEVQVTAGWNYPPVTYHFTYDFDLTVPDTAMLAPLDR